MADIQKLIGVMEEIRLLVLRPDNNFDYSGWEDEKDALIEIDHILSKLRANVPITSIYMGVLFLPTGPLQELSLSSGWGDEFVELADRFDEAMAAPTPCTCLESPAGNLEEIKDLGMDVYFAEVTLLSCPLCQRIWLRYYYANEGISGSGRWYMAPIESDDVTAAEAKTMLEQSEWYFYGGSYFGGKTGKAFGVILIA